MTQLDVMYRYGLPPAEATMMALAKVREVYGVRQLAIDEAEKTVRVEYDATRLTDPIVLGLLRRTGLDVVEKVSLVPPQPPAEVPTPAAAS
jgi:hypothetical protein